jgi:hypothetical protein
MKMNDETFRLREARPYGFIQQQKRKIPTLGMHDPLSMLYLAHRLKRTRSTCKKWGFVQ